MNVVNLMKTTTNRHMLFKTEEMQNLAQIESSLLKGGRRYCEDNNFVEISVPHLTKATGSCENFMTVFEVDHFGRKRYLSQTGQLYLEILTPFLKKVWCLIHSFRAEPKVDGRHLTEFPLLEIEFEGNFNRLIKHIENLIYSIVTQVKTERREELEFFGVDKEHLDKFKPPYERISYTEAIEKLKDVGTKIVWGDDIKSSHEKILSKHLGGKPFFLTHWPTPIKFFDMKTNDENPDVVNSCDLILPYGGEAVGGAEREHIYETLKGKLEKSIMLKLLKERGGDIKDFEWFLDFYKNHEVKLHSGCGIGVTRVTQSLLKFDDIRACTLFPMNREFII